MVLTNCCYCTVTHKTHWHLTLICPLFGSFGFSWHSFCPSVWVTFHPYTTLLLVLECSGWVEGLLWIERVLCTKGSPALKTPQACDTLQREGLRSGCRLLGSTHLQRSTNFENIYPGHVTCFPYSEPYKSTGALLNVNKVVMLLTQSESSTEMITCSLLTLDILGYIISAIVCLITLNWRWLLMEVQSKTQHCVL